MALNVRLQQGEAALDKESELAALVHVHELLSPFNTPM